FSTIASSADSAARSSASASCAFDSPFTCSPSTSELPIVGPLPVLLLNFSDFAWKSALASGRPVPSPIPGPPEPLPRLFDQPDFQSPALLGSPPSHSPIPSHDPLLHCDASWSSCALHSFMAASAASISC